MNNKHLCSKVVLATTFALLTQSVNAAGFQVNEVSATGLGRAFAGDAVIGDNASIIARNAAVMALFDTSQFSTGVNVINTSIDITDVTYQGDALDSAHNGSTIPVPNFYYIHHINDDWSVGIAGYSNFGTENNFDNDFGGEDASGIFAAPTAKRYGGTTELRTMNLGLMGSYRVNEHVSVGAGLDVIYGNGTLIRDTGVSEGNAINDNALDVDASGIGLGWNIGFIYEINDGNRFGFAYHASPKVNAGGDIFFNDEGGTENLAEGEDIVIPLPDIAEFSGYHEISNTNFALHYSIEWVQWSVFDKLEGSNGTLLNDYNWKNSAHYSIGTSYFLNDAWTLRAGYMYDVGAQDEKKSISVPDSDRQWFSAGFSYHFAKQHTIDFGFTYLVGQDVSVMENDQAVPDLVGGSVLTATSRADAIMAGLQYSYSFL